MSFLFSYIRKKLFSKRMQTLILLCAISVTAALFIVANAMTELIKDAYVLDLENKYIGADIYIQDTDEESIEDSMWKNHKDIESGIGTIECTSVCYPGDGDESAYINLEGIQKAEISEFEKYDFVQKRDDRFSGDDVYIDEQMAEKYGIQLGDQLPVRFGPNVRDCQVAGIYRVEGMTSMANTAFLSYGVIVERKTLQDFMQVDYNTLYLKCADGVNVHTVVKQLQSEYPGLQVSAVSEDMIHQEVKGIFTTLNFLAVLVIITCFYIMVTSYKVIIKKRIHELGILRSLGATKKYVRRILITEAIMLGAIGGGIGSVLGYVVVYVVSKVTVIDGIPIHLHINIGYVVEALVITILVAAVGAFFAAFRLVKASVTEILLDNQEEKVHKSKARYVGFVLLIASFIFPLLTKSSGKELAASVDCLSILLCLVGTIMAIPLFIDVMRACFKKLLSIINDSKLFLCMNELQNNRNTMNSIAIVAISVASVLLISIVGMGIMKSTADFFSNDVAFDIWLGINGATDETVAQLKEYENIENVYASREVMDVESLCNGRNYTIERVQGVKDETILDYLKFEIDEKLLSKIDNGRYVVLTDMLKDQFQAEVGDSIILSVNGNECQYEIIGFYDTVFDGGNTALISDRYLAEDLDSDSYRMLYVKIADKEKIDETVQEIKEEYYQEKPSINLNKTLAADHLSSQKQMMSIQSIFIVFCIVISIVGVLNNILLNYENKQKYYAIYQSLGMSKMDLMNNLLIESVLIGLLGGMIGSFMFRMIIYIIPYLFKAVAAPKIHLNMPLYVAGVVIGISCITTIVVSVLPAKTMTNCNIILGLKKE